MNNKNKLHENVIVDWLAFTVPLAEFRHLERANLKDSGTRYKWKSLPKQGWKNAKSASVKEEMIEHYQTQYADCCFIRFRQWMEKILGVRVSAPLDKGLHGYSNSYRILALENTTELGFVGFGGNNNTVFIQLTGEGCSHVFSKIRPFVLHFWLTKVLSVHKLARIDLAYDDFDGNYDTSYAVKAYTDEAFRNPTGGRNQVIDIRRPQVGSELQGDTVYIGTRKSNIFWRIYDKALQQGLSGQVWYRNEVELKKVNAKVLENPAEAFAGLNRFASSVNLEHGLSYRALTRRAVLDFAGRLKWVRRQCGRTLSDVLQAFDGDVFAAFGAICDSRGGKFSIPDTQSQLLQTHLQEVIQNENSCNRL